MKGSHVCNSLPWIPNSLCDAVDWWLKFVLKDDLFPLYLYLPNKLIKALISPLNGNYPVLTIVEHPAPWQGNL